MKLAIVIARNDGTEDKILAEFADFIKYEEVHNIGLDKLMNNLRVRDIAWLAWHSEVRRKKTSLSWDEWPTTVEGVIIDTEADKIVPLERTQPIG